MTSESRSGVTSEQVQGALKALGVEVLDWSPDEPSRAELLGKLLAATEGALLVEKDEVALEAARRGYFEAIFSQVRALGVPEAAVDTALQMAWVRRIDLRMRRALYDWNFLRQGLPEVIGQHHGASVVDSLLSAAIEMVEPYYPKQGESAQVCMVRFRDALARAGGRMAAANRSLGAFRRVLKGRGISV